MPKGPSLVFVTGTGTGVGKTHISCLLTRSLQEAGLRILSIKQVETGFSTKGEPGSDMARLAQACGAEPGTGTVYALPIPTSPHLAAAAAGLVIEEKRLKQETATLLNHRQDLDLVIQEGAGGLRVPLRPGYEVIDLLRDLAELDVRVLLIARAGLGTLNETLLSLEALVHRGLPIAGVLLNENQPGESPYHNAIVADNLAYLRVHGGCPVLGVVPYGCERLTDSVPLSDLRRALRV